MLNKLLLHSPVLLVCCRSCFRSSPLDPYHHDSSGSHRWRGFPTDPHHVRVCSVAPPPQWPTTAVPRRKCSLAPVARIPNRSAPPCDGGPSLLFGPNSSSRWISLGLLRPPTSSAMQKKCRRDFRLSSRFARIRALDFTRTTTWPASLT